MFKTNQSEFIDAMMNPEFCKKHFGKDYKPEIRSKEDLVRTLYELIELTNNIPDCVNDYVNTRIPKSLESSIYDFMKRMYAVGSHICEKLLVCYDGTVVDGKGFVYAGWAKKNFKIGDHLPKKYSNKIYKLAQNVCTNPPRIMLSKVDTKDPKKEYYYYFKSVEDDECVEHYECFYVLTNSDNLSLHSFYHYIYAFLPKEFNVFENVNLNYPLDTKEQHDILIELEKLPMGSLINTYDKLVVKSTPIGKFDYMELYNGAIDL